MDVSRFAFDAVLVANRGEIALRILRALRAMGLRGVAVHSEPDRDAPHVAFADDAVCIGPGPAAQSYLDPARILDAARATGAGAIHPGYGFLSENADFVRAVVAAGLVFIGPGAEAVEIMGDKARAKRLMGEAGVPCLPGHEGDAQDDASLTQAAARIGFPLMVKAAAGGGGRGMRLVAAPGQLAEALTRARAEALAGFGSDRLILERAVPRPRHVEIQIIADHHGAILHLGERDCSVQRRHQKVIEESPAPGMTPALRAAMGEAAILAAKAVGYRGAGTVEFLLDDDENFHFLEMNTRLQVEHPVTEAVTGRDLVQLQVAVAGGAPLGFSQADVALSGHAIEARLYAEDPGAGFLPATGAVALWRAPDGVRVDAGVGAEVSPHYDPMLAKIIAHGPDRDAARRRLIAALETTALLGPATNRGFLIAALKADGFARRPPTTAFIAETFAPGALTPAPVAFGEAAIAAALVVRRRRAQSMAAAVSDMAPLANWWSNGAPVAIIDLHFDGARRAFTLRPDGETYHVRGDGVGEAVVRIDSVDDHGATVTLDGRRLRLFHAWRGGDLLIGLPDRDLRVTVADESARRQAPAGGEVRAPMHGRIAELRVAPGDAVDRGQILAVLEAMKMQHEILAPVAGTVARAPGGPGAQVAAGDLLVDITPPRDGGATEEGPA